MFSIIIIIIVLSWQLSSWVHTIMSENHHLSSLIITITITVYRQSSHRAVIYPVTQRIPTAKSHLLSYLTWQCCAVWRHKTDVHYMCTFKRVYSVTRTYIVVELILQKRSASRPWMRYMRIDFVISLIPVRGHSNLRTFITVVSVILCKWYVWINRF